MSNVPSANKYEMKDFKDFLKESEQLANDDIVRNFGLATSSSHIFIKRKDYPIYPLTKRNPGFDFVCQKGRSIDIPMKIVYVRKGRFKPKKVTARPTVMKNMALRAAAKNLPQNELTKKASKYLADFGTYDRELLYDTSQLVSFPELDRDGSIDLWHRETKNFTARITIPSDFPDDMLNDPVLIMLKPHVCSKGIGGQIEDIRLLVVP